MRKLVTAKLVTASVLTLGLGIWGCSGGNSSGSTTSPTAPTPTTPSGAVTINVVAINGAQSFSPNPATLPGPDGRVAQRQQHDASCGAERWIPGHRRSRARGVE